MGDTMSAWVRATVLTMAAALPLMGCAGGAATQSANGVYDPYEHVNRFLYKVNGAIDAVILRPASLAYLNVVPAPARTGVHNVLDNLNSPIIFANDVLQGSASRSGDTALRFLVNSTLGVGGIFDVAAGWGYKYQDTDFGVTLALWGVPSGPFLFLPILGPTDPRDAIGYGVDGAADPFNYIGKGDAVTALIYARFGMTAIDKYSNAMGQLAAVEKTALDPYATLRSLYMQNRASVIAATRKGQPTP